MNLMLARAAAFIVGALIAGFVYAASNGAAPALSESIAPIASRTSPYRMSAPGSPIRDLRIGRRGQAARTQPLTAPRSTAIIVSKN